MAKPKQPGDGVGRGPSKPQIEKAHEKQRQQAKQKALLRKIEREMREKAK